MNPELSIVIPAYNEENRIAESLVKAYDYLQEKKFDFEFIVVDDGSKDDTSGAVKKLGLPIKLLQQGRNMGKGAAVRRGLLEARGDIRLFSDADFSTPIYEINKLLPEIAAGYDICIGSRALQPDLIKERQPFYREFMGKTFNKIIQASLFRGIKDTQCGFKAFKAEAAEKIFSAAKINGFSFDVEALYLARKFGYKICETPVEWYNDKRSTVNPIKDSFHMFMELFKIRKLHKGL